MAFSSARLRWLFPLQGAGVMSFFLPLFLLVLPLPTYGEIEVAVSILPQKYFVEQIGGPKVHVTVMVPPGANPATYEPRPRQMALLSRASLYFAVGVPFERTWLKRFEAANPNMKVVKTQEGIRLYPISERKTRKTSHKSQILDPHVWLSPPLVILQARNITTALCSSFPGQCNYFLKNFEAFCSKVVDLDVKIMEILSQGRHNGQGVQRAFLVFHPSWGYFARAYGLRQIAIEQEGKEPKPAQLLKIISVVKKLGIKVVILQPQFSPKAARIVAKETGAMLLVADPLSYNWPQSLLKLAKWLGKYL